MTMAGVSFIPIKGLPEVQPGMDLAALLAEALQETAHPGDLLIVTQKVVSKAEGRLVCLRDIEPSPFARSFARRNQRDPRLIELIFRESRRVVRMAEGGLIICETPHGFICANAGIDLSNVSGGDIACLLPEDPDASALHLHKVLSQTMGFGMPVIISDSFGRPWRDGIVNVAIGVAGMNATTDYRGQRDARGYELKASLMATADALASGSEVVTGKTDAIPAVLVRGFAFQPGPGTGRDLLMEPSRNLYP